MLSTELSLLFDLTVVVALVCSSWLGWRTDIRRSFGGPTGALLGIALAFFTTPLLAHYATNAIVAAVTSALLCSGFALGGYVVGARLSRAFMDRLARRRQLTELAPSIGMVGRAVGALSCATVGAVLVSTMVLVSSNTTTSVFPHSGVLRSVHTFMPAAIIDVYTAMTSVAEPSKSFRDLAIIGEAAGLIRPATEAPAAVSDVAASIVKVMGTAWKCGHGFFGTGLVVAPERVVTNAHVIAGASDVIVITSENVAVEGSIVYFDPRHDLAVIAVPGLASVPLELDYDHVEGDAAFVAGFPSGGSFTTTPAVVQARTTGVTNNIYGTEGVVLEYLTIAGSVPSGTSGSPLLTLDGDVAGLVFARAENSTATGYALALRHLAPVIDRAAGYLIKVDTGPCLDR